MARGAHIRLSAIPSHASRVACRGTAQLQLRDCLILVGYLFCNRQVSRQHHRDRRCRRGTRVSQRLLGRTAARQLSPHGPPWAAWKENACDEGGMSTATLHDWMGRVLDQGRVGSPVNDHWKLEAYEQYHARLRAPEYPCFFGQSGEARGEMLYTFIDEGGMNELVQNMQEFVRL